MKIRKLIGNGGYRMWGKWTGFEMIFAWKRLNVGK